MTVAAPAETDRRHKPVEQRDADTGALIKVWPSQKTAADALGIKHGSISAAVLGRHKLGGGFEWRASAPRAQSKAAQSTTRPQAKAAQRATKPQPKAAQRTVRRSPRL